MIRKLKNAFFFTYTLFLLSIIIDMMMEKPISDDLLKIAITFAYFVGVFSLDMSRGKDEA